MSLENILNEFNSWLDEREITGVEISENLGAAEDITAITFPIPADDGYISYDIIATMEEDAPLYFYIDYCDVPEADELELLRFVNHLNANSSMNVTVEEGHLCFGYTLSARYVTSGEQLALAFFDIWDAIDDIRDEVRDAFGIAEELSEDTESLSEEE